MFKKILLTLLLISGIVYGLNLNTFSPPFKMPRGYFVGDGAVQVVKKISSTNLLWDYDHTNPSKESLTAWFNTWMPASDDLGNDSFTVGPDVGSSNIRNMILVEGNKVVLIDDDGYIKVYDYVLNSIVSTLRTSSTFYAYTAMCLLPNGDVVLGPNTVNHIGIYRPSTNTFTQVYDCGSAPNLTSAHLLPDNSIYFASYNSLGLRYYPSTNTIATYPSPVEGDFRNINGTSYPDGRVFMFSLRGIGSYRTFNYVTNIATEVSPGLLPKMSLTGLSNDCEIVGTPNAAVYLDNFKTIYNPSTNVFTTTPPLSGYSPVPYSWTCLKLPNGKMFETQLNRTSFLLYDPSDNTFQDSTATGTFSFAGAFSCGVLLPGGRVLLGSTGANTKLGIYHSKDTGMTALQCRNPYINRGL